ncbi:hypothetical protein FQR65_LT03028 [Abscondita terminalis]|nr:hypothetical protein FQR65_LT03028 [Abscondita terminalis]
MSDCGSCDIDCDSCDCECDDNDCNDCDCDCNCHPNLFYHCWSFIIECCCDCICTTWSNQQIQNNAAPTVQPIVTTTNFNNVNNQPQPQPNAPPRELQSDAEIMELVENHKTSGNEIDMNINSVVISQPLPSVASTQYQSDAQIMGLTDNCMVSGHTKNAELPPSYDEAVKASSIAVKM